MCESCGDVFRNVDPKLKKIAARLHGKNKSFDNLSKEEKIAAYKLLEAYSKEFEEALETSYRTKDGFAWPTIRTWWLLTHHDLSKPSTKMNMVLRAFLSAAIPIAALALMVMFSTGMIISTFVGFLTGLQVYVNVQAIQEHCMAVRLEMIHAITDRSRDAAEWAQGEICWVLYQNGHPVPDRVKPRVGSDARAQFEMMKAVVEQDRGVFQSGNWNFGEPDPPGPPMLKLMKDSDPDQFN